MDIKDLEPDLLKSCHDYLMAVEPIPQGPILIKGLGLIPGLVEGEVSDQGGILYLKHKERPSIERLARAQAITFQSADPDHDLLSLCRNVGLPAIGNISECPQGAILLDGLRGNIHQPGPLKENTACQIWEQQISTSLPAPVLTALDNIEELDLAFRRGASGIGLIRTEHLCQTSDRLPLLQQLMLLDSGPLAEKRASELGEKLANDLAVIFYKCGDRPVFIRFFDPPPHEFLDLSTLSKLQTIDGPNFKSLFDERDSIAPTLVQRGLRTHWRQPALMSAFIKSLDLASKQVPREIHVVLPMVSTKKEILRIRQIFAKRPWKLGAMIETPAALAQAPEWLEAVDFLSIGGNDLAQAFWGLSRDDRRDLHLMLKENLIESDPFSVIDPVIKKPLEICLNAGREAQIPVNFCGHQATDLESARFLIKAGVSLLTCSVNDIVPLRLQLSGVLKPKA